MRLQTTSIRALAGALFWIAALTGASVIPVQAEMTVSRSNDPAADIGGRLQSLLGVERAGFGQVGAERMAALGEGVRAPVRPGRKTAEPEAPSLIRYDAGWLAAQPVASGDAQWECLSKALYFEARGETVKGQFAVAEVILNRVANPAFPGTVCAVVSQAGGGGCQFSYICDRQSDRIREQGAWRQVGKIARLMLDGAPRALTEGATHFHTVNVNPRWAKAFPRTAAIGEHLFYRAN